MKDEIIKILKFTLPILLGLYVAWYFWNMFSEEDKEVFYDVFKDANYTILFLSLLVGLASHLARAKRWLYALKPLGYKPSIYSSFYAIMIAYLMNIILPRLGEISRASVLATTDKVPFEKGFGTIIVERVIDLLCLLIIGGIALIINMDNIDALLMLADTINSGNPKENSSSIIGIIFISLFVGGIITAIVLWFFNTKIRNKIKDLISGFIIGVKSIIQMKDRWAYIFYTLIIWICYIVMFWIPFYCWSDMYLMSFDGLLSAFIAGTLGFIVVQGGLGTYPIMVGIVITYYMAPDYFASNSVAKPEFVGFATLIWLSQTVLVVVLGLMSFILVRRVKTSSKT